MSKGQTTALKVKPEDHAAERKALLKQISRSDLNSDLKTKLVTDIQNDDPEAFMNDGGMQILNQISNDAGVGN